MIDFLLQRLEMLQAELAGLDPAHEVNYTEVNVTIHVAAMAKALRDVLSEADKGAVRSSGRAERAPPRAVTG